MGWTGGLAALRLPAAAHPAVGVTVSMVLSRGPQPHPSCSRGPWHFQKRSEFLKDDLTGPSAPPWWDTDSSVALRLGRTRPAGASTCHRAQGMAAPQKVQWHPRHSAGSAGRQEAHNPPRPEGCQGRLAARGGYRTLLSRNLRDLSCRRIAMVSRRQCTCGEGASVQWGQGQGWAGSGQGQQLPPAGSGLGRWVRSGTAAAGTLSAA